MTQTCSYIYTCIHYTFTYILYTYILYTYLHTYKYPYAHHKNNSKIDLQELGEGSRGAGETEVDEGEEKAVSHVES